MNKFSSFGGGFRYRVVALKSILATWRAQAVLISLLSLGLSSTAYAEFDNISVNGELIDQELFTAYKSAGLPVQDYCFPTTEQYVINYVVKRQLIVDAGQAAGFKPKNHSESWDDVDRYTAPEDLEYRHYLINGKLESHAKEYAMQLIGDDAIINVKDKYLYMLASNDPLVVDVTLVRIAQIPTGSRVGGEQAMQRLIAGESIDSIANEIADTGSSIVEQSSRWRHVATLPALDGGLAPEVNSLFGPYYSSREWFVGKILETKKAPVFLLADELRRYESLQKGLWNYLERKNHELLVKKLWESTQVTIGGKPLPYPDSNFCGDSLL